MKPAVWFERFWQDLRHGIRVFAKSPGFTAIAILSIACGTGANVAMFSVADALLLRPLPVARPGELLIVGSRTEQGIFRLIQASYPQLVALQIALSLRQGLKPSWIGLVVGLVLSTITMRTMPAFLPGRSLRSAHVRRDRAAGVSRVAPGRLHPRTPRRPRRPDGRATLRMIAGGP